MANAAENPGPVASKLALVCALALSASTFANDAEPLNKTPAIQVERLLHTPQEADPLAWIPGLLIVLEQLNASIDRAHTDLMSGDAPEHLLQKHPFDLVAEIFGRAVQEIRVFKGTGNLGPNGDTLITALAESRYKADRTANLIRQMTTKATPYSSPIDRDGLVELAKLGREANQTFKS